MLSMMRKPQAPRGRCDRPGGSKFYSRRCFAAQFEEQTSRAAEEENKRFASFRAAKVPKAVSDREAVFTPRRSNKPLTETTNIEFASDRRTQQRQAFDMKMAQKQVTVTLLFVCVESLCAPSLTIPSTVFAKPSFGNLHMVWHALQCFRQAPNHEP